MRLKIIIAAAVCAVLVCVVVLIVWQRRRVKRVADREQMDRKMREDALDRALSNKHHRSLSSQPQSPFEIRYNGEQVNTKDVEMLRLTEQAETITREYLVRKDNTVYLGEDHGHAALFYQLDERHTAYCEIFPNEAAVYIRKCRSDGGQLVRGKNRTALNTKGIKLCNGDLIEINCGTFLVEFI